MSEHPLTDEERARYEWQIWVDGFGESGQARLKGASILISRVGGLGGPVAMQLAAAGVGRLVLAHAGNAKPSDLNRQLLLTTDSTGQQRVATAKRRLAEFNPLVEVEAVVENLSEQNAERLVGSVDLVVDCAPLFEERYAMNAAAMRLNKPIVECGMYDLEAQLTTMLPGQTPCLACLYPEKPAWWRREFPVFGAVSGSLGCLAAMEAIKVLAGFGDTLASKLLVYNLRTMQFRTIELQRRPNCPVCASRPKR
ncbi:HesA/MoeB/ThiF family protein [Aeoliella sp.]|uniref:HesA/MoeB/ThiF family protein n=1 Tax=Aeoliella sp. TaxID=2795800 RepID=UPI003CCBD81B